MSDIILDILNSLNEADKIEVNSLSRPLAGDGVYCVSRDLEGKYGGGIIIDANHEEDEYLVAWWNPEHNGITLDCTIFEKLDFTHYSDGRTGRLWFTS